MADVQLENGFTKIANELLDAIQSFRFTQNQFKLLLALWRNTYGWNRKQCKFSTNDIVSQTGLQRTRVIETLQSLIENKVVFEVKPPVGTSARIVEFNKNYAEWTIQKYKGVEVRGTQNVTSTGTQNDTCRVPQIDTPQNDRGTQNDTPGVLETTPLRGTQNVTSTGTQSGTPLNKKEILKTINIKTEEKKDAAVLENTHDENFAESKLENPKDDSPEFYLRKLLNRFVELRAHGFDFKPTDLNAAKEIHAAGVPLQEAISSLEEAFRNYNPRHPRDRIHSLSYCVGFILDRHFPATAKSNYKKYTRQELVPEWFKNEQEPETGQIEVVSDPDIEAKRIELQKQLENMRRQNA